MGCQGAILPGGYGARPGAVLSKDSVEHGSALGGCQHGTANAQQPTCGNLVGDPAARQHVGIAH